MSLPNNIKFVVTALTLRLSEKDITSTLFFSGFDVWLFMFRGSNIFWRMKRLDLSNFGEK